MSRIAGVFESLKSAGRKALIPYITAGDPHPDHTVGLMQALVEAGADILELGVPFSDPMADGPVIQLACERALLHHTSLRQVIGMVAEFRQRDTRTPVVLMGYLNPIEALGLAHFAQSASAAGVDGVLVVDLAVEEAPEFSPTLRAAGLDCIFLLAPTSPAARIRAAAELASGYLYYVSLKGVTGAANLDVDSVAAKLAEIRGITALPVAVGFGIRDAASASAVAAVSDGVIVGSALVSEIERNQNNPSSLAALLRGKLAPMRAAMDAGRVG
ncbi:MAG: tryptophan synthase subunit alpha [Panacagrimonas sp.]